MMLNRARIGGLVVVGIVAGACGLETGGVLDAISPGDGGVDASLDVFQGSDVIRDIQIPDLGAGETESGAACTCTPAVPAGWSVLAYTPTTRPGCSMGYDTATPVFENPMGSPATCACTCNGVQNAPVCTASTSFALAYDAVNTCMASSLNMSVGPGCTNGSWALNPGGQGLKYLGITANAPAPSGGTCQGATPTVNKPASSADTGRTCQITGKPSACGGGLACVPPPAAGETICISNPNPMACPSSYPNPHVIGTSVNDQRGCGPDACSCVVSTPGTCSKPKLSLFDKTNCQPQDNQVNAQLADGTCTLINKGGGFTAQSAKYDSTNSGAACSFTGNFGPTGAVTLGSTTTICCL